MIEPELPFTADDVDHLVPALKNSAVALCSHAWDKKLRKSLAETKRPFTAKRLAASAYRMAMPPLTGYQNICDFIACVSFGILLGAIKADAGSKLLYAAQIAMTTIAPLAKTQKRPFYSIPVSDIPYL